MKYLMRWNQVTSAITRKISIATTHGQIVLCCCFFLGQSKEPDDLEKLNLKDL